MDIDRLVELATKAIYERINSGKASVAAFGNIPEGLIAGAEVKNANNCADADGCEYVVMSIERFYELLGLEGKPAAGVIACECEGRVLSLSGKRLIHERDIRDLNAAKGDVVKVSKSAIITALAYDYVKGIGAKFQKE